MRFLPFLSAAMLGTLMACSTDSQSEKAASSTATEVQRRNAINQLHIPFANPVLFDSSAYVLYPLPLDETITEENDEYSSKSYSRENTYWNFIFYNSHTGQIKLLDEHRKMVIQSYQTTISADPSVASSNYRISHPLSLADQLIFYSVTINDFNQDKKLTADDPTYLFASDRTGRNFRQLSPDSLHVTNWQIQELTGKILIQTIRDTNHDRHFGNEDEVIPYVYDLATGQPATRIFDPSISEKLKTTFQNNWGKKLK